MALDLSMKDGQAYADVNVQSSVELTQTSVEDIALGTISRHHGMERMKLDGMMPSRFMVTAQRSWPRGWHKYLVSFRAHPAGTVQR
jgi:hypothetical protein